METCILKDKIMVNFCRVFLIKTDEDRDIICLSSDITSAIKKLNNDILTEDENVISVTQKVFDVLAVDTEHLTITNIDE